MSKYIIEIIDEPYTNGVDGAKLYRVKNFSSLVFDSFGLSRLKKLDTTPEEAYESGMYDAWETARKIVGVNRGIGLAPDKRMEIFGAVSYTEILRNNTAQEAVKKIEGAEQRKLDKELTKKLKEVMDSTDVEHFRQLLKAAAKEKDDEQI